MTLVVVGLLLLHGLGFGDFVDDVLFAESVNRLESIHQREKTEEALWKACELQIKTDKMPWSCFHKYLNEKRKPQRAIDLSGICRERAQSLEALEVPQDIELSGSCARRAAEKIKINRYRAGLVFD